MSGFRKAGGGASGGAARQGDGTDGPDRVHGWLRSTDMKRLILLVVVIALAAVAAKKLQSS